MLGQYNELSKKPLSGLKEKPIKHIKLEEVKDLFSIFEFKEEIGHGSFGIVVEAIEKTTSKVFAIKIVNKYASGNAKLLELHREIKILKSVSHPNIIILHRIYEIPKKMYMVFELCHGNLFNKFKTASPFSEKTTRKILMQITEAVNYLHKNEIVHRDIKMENILLATNPDDQNDEFFIKLTDFGLSIIKSATGISGMLKEQVGTIIYMSPEILLDRTYSELCDVWSIGVILYTLMYGRYPFVAANEKELTTKITSIEPDYPTKVVENDCIDLMRSTLVKDPAKRITTSEMLKHPWMAETKMKRGKNQTVIDYMKQWRSEMMLPGEESDWVSAITSVDHMSEITDISTYTRKSNEGPLGLTGLNWRRPSGEMTFPKVREEKY